MVRLTLIQELSDKILQESLIDNRFLQGVLIGKLINDAIDNIFERNGCYFNESLDLDVEIKGNPLFVKEYQDFFNDEELLHNMSQAALVLYQQQLGMNNRILLN